MDKLEDAIIRDRWGFFFDVALKQVTPNENHLIKACVSKQPHAPDIIRKLLEKIDPSTIEIEKLFSGALQNPENVKALLMDPRIDPSKEDNWPIRKAVGMAEGDYMKGSSASDIEIFKKYVRKPVIESFKLLLEHPKVSDSLGDERKYRYMKMIAEFETLGKKLKSTRRSHKRYKIKKTRCSRKRH